MFAAVNTRPIIISVTTLRWPDGHVFWVATGIAVTLVSIGNFARTLRTKVLLDNGKRGTAGSQFRYLSVGYLFNLLFPFRVGEFVRSYLLARQLRIGLLYTLLAVLIERLLDVILISAVYLAIAATSTLPMGLTLAALAIFAGSVVTLIAFVLLLKQNTVLMGLVWRGSRVLNTRGEQRIRMSVWSVVHGFQQFLASPKNVVRYLGFFLLSWVAYLGALILLFATAFPHELHRFVLGSVAPFLFPQALFGSQSFQVYTNTLSSFFVSSDIVLNVSHATFIAALVWAVLNLPTAIYGFVCLLGRGLSIRTAVDNEEGEGKSRGTLDRSTDRGTSLDVFLDSFFLRQGLAQALHQSDVRGEIELIRFYKGGSDAVTALIRDESGTKVKKLVPIEYRSALKRQHDWLLLRGDVPGIVDVLDEHVHDDYYAIDLSFDASTVSLFTYVHTHSLKSSVEVLSTMWNTVVSNVYDLQPIAHHPQARDNYIEERLVTRVELAATAHPDLALALSYERITIGNVEYKNFREIIAAIKGQPQAWHDLGMFQTSTAIHGDLTIDNVLVNVANGSALIIDPSDDNQIRGPIIDFARQFQSLWGGYEFLNDQDDAPRIVISPDGARASLEYADIRSARYEELADWTWAKTSEHLAPEELRSLPFHVGLFYGRMLTHRVTINPVTALIYYGKSVEFLNRFYSQYPDCAEDTAR